MRRFVVALLALGLFGSQALAANTQPQPSMTTAQARVLADLPEVRTVALDAAGVPTFIAGRLGHLGAGDPAGAALRYLERLRPLLRATGREEVAPARVERDDLGQVHVKLQQFHRGLPVVGAELVVHADAATGEVSVVNGRFVPDEGLPVRARIGAEAALLKAAQDAGIREGRVLDQPELVYVVSHDEKTYLAWSAHVAYAGEYGPALDRVFASALDGDLVTLHPTIHSAKNRKIYNGNHTNPDNPTLPGTLLFSGGRDQLLRRGGVGLLRQLRLHLRLLQGPLQPRLLRQRRRGAHRHRARRHRLGQRLLERHPDGVRRRRRHRRDLPLQGARHRRPRAHARGHRAHGEPRLPERLRRPQRGDVGHLRRRHRGVQGRRGQRQHLEGRRGRAGPRAPRATPCAT